MTDPFQKPTAFEPFRHTLPVMGQRFQRILDMGQRTVMGYINALDISYNLDGSLRQWTAFISNGGRGVDRITGEDVCRVASQWHPYTGTDGVAPDIALETMAKELLAYAARLKKLEGLLGDLRTSQGLLEEILTKKADMEDVAEALSAMQGASAPEDILAKPQAKSHHKQPASPRA